MFEQAFVDRGRTPNKKWAMAGSFVLQVAMIGSALMVPLVFVDELPAVLSAGVFLAPTVPPGPPPPPPLPTEITQQVVREYRDFVQPTEIPREVQIIVEDAPPQVAQHNYIGIPGGDPAGVPDGVIGSIVTRTAQAPPPPVEKPVAPKFPVVKPVETVDARIGGDVQPPALLKQVAPVYPPMAILVRVSGAVKIEAIIGVNGRIASARVVSGHPLLMQAALDAVRQWIYRPTLLNGNPVKVKMQVTVNFKLG